MHSAVAFAAQVRMVQNKTCGFLSLIAIKLTWATCKRFACMAEFGSVVLLEASNQTQKDFSFT
jgi:hypothetical protein